MNRNLEIGRLSPQDFLFESRGRVRINIDNGDGGQTYTGELCNGNVTVSMTDHSDFAILTFANHPEKFKVANKRHLREFYITALSSVKSDTVFEWCNKSGFKEVD